MTAQWFVFAFVMPATIVAIGWFGAIAFLRGLDREDEAARKRDSQPKA